MQSTHSIPAVERPEWKRFQNEDSPAPFPLLVLDASATIRQCTPTAYRLLRHPEGALEEQSFLSLVHGRNVQRVMRDLAHLVRRRMQTASWLLRLRAGTGRWQWYRVRAHVSSRAASLEASGESSPALFIRLRPV
jgi:PAS domain-containing protein